MKIGVIGLGSIGQRHIRALKELGYTDIVALRTGKGVLKSLPKELKYVQELTDVKDFYSFDLDGIIVSNPSSLHIDTMKLPLAGEIPIFVEKPLASSLEQTKKLEEYDTSKVMVGFCLRYHEIVQSVNNFISSGKMGKIYKANLYCGHFLPFWHKYADYRKEYFSRKELGGGALRTLSHELDLVHYFFGEIKELCGSVEKISDLEIDVDDNVYIICRMMKNFLVTVELDYLNPICTRNGIIFGANGTLEYSFSGKVTFTNYKEGTKLSYNNSNIDLDKIFINQMRDFTDFVSKKKKSVCSYEDGLYVMKIIHAVEDSMKCKSWKKIEVR
jgi:predicted dehydrogenase